MQKTSKPKGLVKLWREIKRPFRQKKKTIVVSNETRQIKSYCPICQHGSEKSFSDFNGRFNALCSNCGSLERHRLIWMVLENLWKNQNEPNCSLLHFAPEPCFSRHFEKIFGSNYFTGDIEPGRAKHVIDITNICFSENSFNNVLCSHVLEHIVDDMTALKELYRVLKPGGTAYLTVPLQGDMTYEDDSIISPEERTKHFGQFDHVRFYGEDFVERVRAIGFSIEVVIPSDIIRHDGLRETLGLSTIDKLFIATKNNDKDTQRNDRPPY